jgi:protoporphyrinogen/coproporphyrinogen III oxidase
VKRVLIAGAGISGLATAFYLRRRRSDLAVTVLDPRDRLGGVITTEARDGFVIEGGPDSFITLKPWGVQLCKDLGIENRLYSTDPANRKVYVLSRGRLEPLPPGVMLTAPTRLMPLLRSRLFTWPGKIRMGMDLFLPRGPEREDESLGSFVRRRLGQEAVDKVAEPILGGIFLAEADQLSLRSTFPRFIEMERTHRSLILALRKQAKPKAEAGGATSPFRTLPGGMVELVEALRAAMPEVEFLTGVRVERIEAPGKVMTTRGTMEADAVVLAVPPPDCARILEDRFPDLSRKVARITTLTTATVSLGYREPAARVPLDATGFVIARGEGRRILACTWTSKKFQRRAPAGHLLVRCFFGGGKNEAIVNHDDAALARIAREELSELMGLQEEPVVSAVHRWPEANPIYEVGHEARVREIEAGLDPALRLHLTGSGFRGIGIPDCVGEAARVAEEVAGRI